MPSSVLKKKTYCFLFNNEQQNYLCNNNQFHLQYSNLYPKEKFYLINIQNFIFEKKKVCRNISNKIEPVYSNQISTHYKFKNNKKLNILIASHCFSDAPHFYGNNIFTDFYEWICFLGNKSKLEKYNFYFKIHPSHYEKNRKEINKLLLRFPNLNLLPRSIGHKQLILHIDVALTVYGSIAHEYPLLGIPVVTAGANPQEGYNFCYNPKTFKEYEKILNNLEKCKVKKNIKNEIYQFYFMHYLTDYFLINNKELNKEVIDKLEIYSLLISEIKNNNFFKKTIDIFTKFIISKKRRVLFSDREFSQ